MLWFYLSLSATWLTNICYVSSIRLLLHSVITQCCLPEICVIASMRNVLSPCEYARRSLIVHVGEVFVFDVVLFLIQIKQKRLKIGFYAFYCR